MLELLLRTASLPVGSGQWNSCALLHCPGAMGSGCGVGWGGVGWGGVGWGGVGWGGVVCPATSVASTIRLFAHYAACGVMKCTLMSCFAFLYQARLHIGVCKRRCLAILLCSGLMTRCALEACLLVLDVSEALCIFHPFNNIAAPLCSFFPFVLQSSPSHGRVMQVHGDGSDDVLGLSMRPPYGTEDYAAMMGGEGYKGDSAGGQWTELEAVDTGLSAVTHTLFDSFEELLWTANELVASISTAPRWPAAPTSDPDIRMILVRSRRVRLKVGSLEAAFAELVQAGSHCDWMDSERKRWGGGGHRFRMSAGCCVVQSGQLWLL